MHSPLEALISQFAKLPGIGPRSARRIVLHLLRRREALLYPLANLLQDAGDSVLTCSNCGNMDTCSPCQICTDPKRDEHIICVVEDLADLWAFERSKIFRGRYHVLGGTLSALDGIGPDQLLIEPLIRRALSPEIEEIILATNATINGQTTAFYLQERLADAQVKITQLAQGIPMGGELDYLDDGTLGAVS